MIHTKLVHTTLYSFDQTRENTQLMIVVECHSSMEFSGDSVTSKKQKYTGKWRTIIMSKLRGTTSAKQQQNYSTCSSIGSCCSSSRRNITIPNEFVCPISNSLMTQPVIVSSGHTFDLSSLHSLHFTIPSIPDGSVPDFSALIPNLALRSAILNFCSANSIPFRPPPIGENPPPLEPATAMRIGL